MTNQARFTINGTPSEDPVTGDRGYEGSFSETLNITLEVSPSSVLAVTYAVYDATDSTSPLSSLDASLLTFVESGSSTQTFTSVNDTAQIILPSSSVESWLIRCSVSTDQGSETFERMISLVTATTPALRKWVPGETAEFQRRGHADEYNKLLEYVNTVVIPSGTMTSVSSLNALRSLNLGVGRVNEIVSILGYSTLQDGGQGFFRFVNDPTLTDNDGTIVDSPIANYYFVRIYDGAINMRWFGARGDDTTNDTTTIQNALDSAHALSEGNGSVVFAPSGVYIHTQIQLNNFQTLDGEDGTVFKLQNNFIAVDALGGIMGRDGIESMTCQNFEYDGNSANQPHNIDRDDYTVHAINCATNNAERTPPEKINLFNLYLHSNMRTCFITFDYEQPNGLNRMSVQASNIRCRNSYHDHFFYLKRSDGNYNNITCEGYWGYSAIASYNQNFTNVIFKNVLENPDINFGITTSMFVQERVSDNGHGSQYQNFFCEFDPLIMTMGFNIINKGGSFFDGLNALRVGSTTGPFDLFRPSIDSENNRIENVTVKEAHSEFTFFDTSTEYTLRNTVFRNINIEFADGADMQNALFEINTTTQGFYVENIRVSTGWRYLFWVHPGVTASNFLFKTADLSNDPSFRAYNISGTATVSDIVVRDHRCLDSGSSLQNTQIKFVDCDFAGNLSNNRGIYPIVGTGAQLVFDIPMGLALTPLYYGVSPLDSNNHSSYSVTISGSNLRVTFTVAPSVTVNFAWWAAISI